LTKEKTSLRQEKPIIKEKQKRAADTWRDMDLPSSLLVHHREALGKSRQAADLAVGYQWWYAGGCCSRHGRSSESRVVGFSEGILVTVVGKKGSVVSVSKDVGGGGGQ